MVGDLRDQAVSLIPAFSGADPQAGEKPQIQKRKKRAEKSAEKLRENRGEGI